MHFKIAVLIIGMLTSQAAIADLSAQSCINDYFVTNYPTPTVQHMKSVVATAQNDIIFTGTVLRKNSILVDGWLTKLSALGTVIWSKRYASGIYNDIHFSKAVPLKDGGFIIAGNVGMVDTIPVPPAQLTQYGILLKADKYGVIQWSKIFRKQFVSNLSTTMDNILVADNGDLIISLTYSGFNSSSIVVKTDANGNFKWTSSIGFMYSTQYTGYFSPMQSVMLRNGNLVFAGKISVFHINQPYFNGKEGYYTFCLDNISGTMLWDKAYIWSAPPSQREKSFGRVQGLTELPNGDLSFISSFADTAFYLFRVTKEVLHFTTDPFEVNSSVNLLRDSSLTWICLLIAVTDCIILSGE